MSATETGSSATVAVHGPDDWDLMGQRLFRQALEVGSLEPFDHVAHYLDDIRLGPQVQGNALKAITFGLAGLAVHGWQESITEELPGPLTIAGETFNYRFADNVHLPPHDPTPIVNQKHAIWGVVTRTQGDCALEVLENGLRATMRDYLSQEGQVIGGIPLAQILGDLEKYVVKGHAEGIDTIPDAYKNGKWKTLGRRSPYKFDDAGKVDVRAAIASTAGNSVRFCRVPITALMRMALEGTTYQTNPFRPFDYEASHAAYDPEKTFRLLVRTVEDPIRAAKQQDGIDTVVGSELSVFPDFYIQQSPHGEEVSWAGKHQRPLKPVGSSPLGQPAGEGAFLEKQRCAATFKSSKADIQPLQKIADAIIVYLYEHGLDKPEAFMAGKYVSRPELLPTKPAWRRILAPLQMAWQLRRKANV